MFDRYGLSKADHQALVLVRPDGFIAWRSEGLDVDGASAFLVRCGAAAAREPETA